MKHLNSDIQDKSVWDISICIGSERLKDEDGKKIHSTQKPEELLYKIILSSTKPGDVVLDPFFGTGTTGAVAKRLGRNYIGLEREVKYINIAEKRIASVRPEANSLFDLSLEIKPPQVKVKVLIETGFLSIGESLFSKQGDCIGILTDKGYVDDGSDTLSIHKMSAKHLNLPNHNGWDFFYVRREGTLKPIDELRYEFSERKDG